MGCGSSAKSQNALAPLRLESPAREDVPLRQTSTPREGVLLRQTSIPVEPARAETQYMRQESIYQRQKSLYMEQKSISVKRTYSGPSIEYLIDIAEGYFDLYSIYNRNSSRYSNTLIASGARALYIPTGFIFLCGGRKSPRGAWGVDMQTGAFTEFSLMSEGREHHSIVYMNGVIYATGGSAIGETSSCEMFLNSSWVTLPSMNKPRSLHSALALNNRIYVYGGLTASSIELFLNRSWVILGIELPVCRNRLGVAPLTDSSILVAGGEDSGSHFSLQAWELDLEEMALTEITFTPDVVVCTGPGTHYEGKAILYSDGASYEYSLSTGLWTTN